jgi:hypothetical protein
MSVANPYAPPIARLSMSVVSEASPEAWLQSVVSSPGKLAPSEAAEPGVPEYPARVKNHSRRRGCARS